MKNWTKTQIILIAVSLLILLGCVGVTAFLLFSNYQNIRLFKQARNNFTRGDSVSLSIAEAQLLQLIRVDDDNEAAYIMLGAIAERQKIYPEQVYYCYMAHRLNPLSAENKKNYLKSLLFARDFSRAENFLSHQASLPEKWNQLLLYSAGRNGNLGKYRHELARRNDNAIAELAFLLFKYKHLTTEQKLFALENIRSEDPFVVQEKLAAQSELYLELEDLDRAEAALKKAYQMNEFAFAPSLGRFYANYRNFKQALSVLEKYLSIYHDPSVAMQTAEIYCLINQPGKIEELRNKYQSDSGNIAMISNYYFDALAALAKNDLAALKDLTVPLRQSIDTPLSAFMFFAADYEKKEPAAILKSYTDLLAYRKYLNFQDRADLMVLDFLKRSVAAKQEITESTFQLAEILYKRKPDPFTAKYILLFNREVHGKAAVLKDALIRFEKDPGIIKIAIESHLNRDFAAAQKLIDSYKKLFPNNHGDMLRYEIALAVRTNNVERASALFRKNFSSAILPQYWDFAGSTMRIADLKFLSKDKLYAPFCQALILLKDGKKEAACAILEKADAKGNLPLLFFAARTLGENGKNQAALQKYAQFPQENPYKLAVLLNMAELFSERKDHYRALEFAQQAYNVAPDRAESQLCYADKLFKTSRLKEIPDVVKITKPSPYRKQLETLWIAGMEQRIKESDLANEREKTREMCRKLLFTNPQNQIALDCMKKLEALQK